MFNYLEKKHDTVLTVNMDVSFKVFEYECSDGTIKLMACRIIVDDATIALRPCL